MTYHKSLNEETGASFTLLKKVFWLLGTLSICSASAGSERTQKHLLCSPWQQTALPLQVDDATVKRSYRLLCCSSVSASVKKGHCLSLWAPLHHCTRNTNGYSAAQCRAVFVTVQCGPLSLHLYSDWYTT